MGTDKKTAAKAGDDLAAAYKAYRESIGKPCRVSHLGNGRYEIAPKRSTGHPVIYTRTGTELRAILAEVAA